MKFLHTADWHLGDSFHGFDREEEHEHFLNWLLGVIQNEEPDALLLCGDIYDNGNPSASAERQLYGFLTRAVAAVPRMKIIMIAGNHDSSLRLEAPRSLYECMDIEVRGVVKRDNKDNICWNDLLIPIEARSNPDDKMIVATIPFLRPDDMEKGKSTSEGFRLFASELIGRGCEMYGKNTPMVLMAHIYAVGAHFAEEEHSERACIGGQDCVNTSKLGNEVAYAALGHIHKEQNVARQDNVRYSGSALPMSFAEKNYEHGIIKVEIADGQTVINKISYEPLRRLMTIPEEGSATPDEVLKLLSNLPKAHEKDDAASWPYLEIGVEEMSPNPATVGAIIKATQDRAVRLCRTIRVRPGGERRCDTEPVATVEDLRKINPAQIARALYKNHYGEDMPDEIARLFAEVKREQEKLLANGQDEDKE